MKGKLAVITGPSAGAGKDTILRIFLGNNPNWHQPVSTTTRQPRSGEIEGQDMHFIDHETFEKLQEEGQFLESDFHAKQWYGTLKQPIQDLLKSGKNVLLRKDVNGALHIKEKIPEAIVVFIKAESIKALEARLRGRQSETEQQIEERLDLARHEMTLEKYFEHVVVNRTGQVDKAAAEFEKILNDD